MTNDKVNLLTVEPIISYPREAEFGKSYLLSIDLRPLIVAEDDWPLASEECVIYCLLSTAPLFSNQPLGEPAVVVHRYGGSYGPATFLLTAAEEEMVGTIRVTLVNGWGIPLTELPLRDIRITKKHLATASDFVLPAQHVTIAPNFIDSSICPYLGLNTFTEADAPFFFRRQQITDELIGRLRQEPRFLAIFGPSGSGKSSVVQAGLIPRLRQGVIPGSSRWEIIITRPTEPTFGQLISRLNQYSTHIAMIIDQFEELFVTFPEAECNDMLKQLTRILEGTTGVTIILVVRDDFYSRLMGQEALARWMSSCLVNMPRTLSRDELLSIVKNPANAVGLQFEDGLIERILQDAGETTSNVREEVVGSTILPLLEFALSQLWELRQDSMLTRKAYERIGGITAALTRWADQTFYSLEEKQRSLAQRIFTDLIQLGDEKQQIPVSRRPRSLTSLLVMEKERTDVYEVVQHLVKQRLLVLYMDSQSKEETVEIINNTLLNHWGLLRQWIAEYQSFVGESGHVGEMSYIDFELEIASGSGRMYPIAVVRSVAGEAHGTMQFPFDELALENQLLMLQMALLRSGNQRRAILSSGEQAVQNFGRALFDALFIGEVRSCYSASQREAAMLGKRLRLKLCIRPPELAALPWEFLYDASMAEYICLTSTSVVRYLDLSMPPQPLTVTLPLRILGMIAHPKDLGDLDVEREKQRVEKAIERLQVHGLVDLAWIQGRTWQDLQRAMRQGPWHVFHFIGHGGFNSSTDEGLIALENEEGRAQFFGATQLGGILADHHSLRLVVLNSCEGARGSERDIFSSTAAILVRRGIPAVLAMQYEITDRAAIELSRAFYEALADGLPVDVAVSETRKAISLGLVNSLEWGIPVLYTRSPDGFIFAIPPSKS